MSNILFELFFFLDKYSRIQCKSFSLILQDRWLIPLCLCYWRWLTTYATGGLACGWYRSYKHKQVLHFSLLLPLLTRKKREEYSSWDSPAVYENNLTTMGTALNPFRFVRPLEGSTHAGCYLHAFSSFPQPLFARFKNRKIKKQGNSSLKRTVEIMKFSILSTWGWLKLNSLYSRKWRKPWDMTLNLLN